jgi:hypothetical protein
MGDELMRDRLDESEVSRRINAITVGPDGLKTLHPHDAWVIACGVVAVTALAVGRSATETFEGVAAALNVALEDQARGRRH